MGSHWVNGLPYYRYRFPAEYALANCIEHPLSVSFRESLVIGEVDRWLAREFSPHRLTETIHELTQGIPPDASDGSREAKRQIAECDRKLAQYRAALDARASPATVAGWIAETEAEKQNYALAMRRSKASLRMTEEEIKSVVNKLTDVIHVLSTANADDKSEIFRQLGLRLTYHPGRRIVEAKIEPAPHGFFGVSEGDLNPGTREISPFRGNFHGPSITARRLQAPGISRSVPISAGRRAEVRPG